MIASVLSSGSPVHFSVLTAVPSSPSDASSLRVLCPLQLVERVVSVADGRGGSVGVGPGTSGAWCVAAWRSGFWEGQQVRLLGVRLASRIAGAGSDGAAQCARGSAASQPRPCPHGQPCVRMASWSLSPGGQAHAHSGARLLGTVWTGEPHVHTQPSGRVKQHPAIPTGSSSGWRGPWYVGRGALCSCWV